MYVELESQLKFKPKDVSRFFHASGPSITDEYCSLNISGLIDLDITSEI